MSGENEKLVEIDRGKVVKMGGTLYIKIPPSVRRQDKIEYKDTILFLKSPDSNRTIIKKLEVEVDDV